MAPEGFEPITTHLLRVVTLPSWSTVPSFLLYVSEVFLQSLPEILEDCLVAGTNGPSDYVKFLGLLSRQDNLSVLRRVRNEQVVAARTTIGLVKVVEEFVEKVRLCPCHSPCPSLNSHGEIRTHTI